MARPFPIHNITDDSALGGSVIEKSLRIDDGDSASLTRTPSSAGNRRTFTISVWAKRSSPNGSAMFGAYISDSDRATLRFTSDNIQFQTSGYSVKTTGKFRDTNAWYHIVAAIDTTQGTQSNRGKIYVNGVQQILQTNDLAQNLDTSVNNNSVQVFGTRWVSGAANGNFDGYLAECNLIDGLQLDASYFGYTDLQTGTWKPKFYSGSYGTNGVRLTFNNTGSFIDFLDESSSKHLLTRTGDVIHTSDQKKNGATSIYFDDSSDTLSTVDSSDFTFGTNDFTIEAYVRRTRQGDDEWFFIQSDGTSANTSIGLHFWSSSYGDVNKPTMRMRIGGSNYDTNGTTVTVANTWYHIAGVRQGNTFRIYVNGVQEGTTTNSGSINDPTTPFIIGAVTASGSAGLKGYMDQVRISNVCRYPDGTSFTPPTAQFTSDSNTKLLVQSNVALNTSLGSDASGNNNHFTPNNLKSSDSLIDTPTNNFATLKTLGTPAETTIGEGNLYLDTNSTGSARANRSTAFSTYFVNSGKWYCEHYHLGINTMIGVAPPQIMRPYTSDNTRYVMVYSGGGNKYINTNGSESNSTYAASYVANNVTGVLIDMDQTTPVMYVSYNGQWANGSGAWNQSNPYTSGGAIPMDNSFFTNNIDKAFEGYCGFWSANAGGGEARHIYNFGQDSTFAGRTTAGGYKDATGIGDFKYPVPDGALALCSNNLSRLDNQRNTTSLINPKKHFDILTYTGDGSSGRSITGLQFQPDFVWVKSRTNTRQAQMSNSVIGAGKIQVPSETDIEQNISGVSAFNHNGFTIGNHNGANENSQNFVAFCWKGGGTAVSNSDGTITSQVSANREAGFSVVGYTGTGSDASVGHGLGAKPQVLWVKSRSNTDSWKVWFKGVTTTDAMSWQLDTNGSNYSGSDKWYNSPNGNDTTTTTFGVSGDNATNRSGAGFVAYCWTAIKGFSSFGTYEGNGQADGPYVDVGFRPAMIIIKSYSNSGGSYNWFMCNSTTGPYNNIYQRLQPNTSDSEVTDASNAATVDFYSNGFKLRGTGSMLNGNTVEYVYMAWAEQSPNTPYASEPNAR